MDNDPVSTTAPEKTRFAKIKTFATRMVVPVVVVGGLVVAGKAVVKIATKTTPE